ncbi:MULTISPECIES: HTH-type transcriptional regulator PuuR [Vibrio]|jgi:HTH-type transcriptional repressor of puuD|uniref:Helix-turn-helix domain-containing protein n=1 Tax=Vibrio diazotrophicus TaxID=685 RepID=A0A2J8HPR4_VIBDI|nr:MULTISPECIES: HTH-type transcriptional regulator PuuR [Vibrio]MCF7361706.1 HTH-type transcriptional regulator PuuR [Vibrio sp. A1-b2]MCZ4373341.1 HTH-type transcriptional regulator PuuR [Vibrio diazotrophicus]PNH81284.1 helix-turn-helix domain-containing protein [Vibrio diazotrophicus]PNH93555.1 helix-turn-helix domain-containing protein [Vibrio diazotrophicus]PNI00265.1 helix-turn-helix domain-containing protein [Vibrio diazotrophicus]
MDNLEIGKTIVQLRKKHELSQRELAERAGITHSAISSIENGKVSPSVSSLQKIVNVFSLSLSEFFMIEQSPKNEAKVVIPSEELVEMGSESVSMKLVTNGKKDQVIGFLIEEYAPFGTTGAREIEHEGEEIGTVLEGQITLEYKGKSHVIKAGESYVIDTNEPHRFTNHTDKACRMISAHTPTTF